MRPISRIGCAPRPRVRHDISAGGEVMVLDRQEHGVTSAAVAWALVGEPQLLPVALIAPELPKDRLWEWAA